MALLLLFNALLPPPALTLLAPALQPGQRFHPMLVNLAKRLREGDSVPMSLNLEKAGRIDLMIQVERLKASGNHHH